MLKPSQGSCSNRRFLTIHHTHTGHCRRPAAAYPALIGQPQNHFGNSLFSLKRRRCIVKERITEHWHQIDRVLVGKLRLSPTFGQCDDTGDDDEDQSKHLNEGQSHLSARGHGHTPAVDRHDKRYGDQKTNGKRQVCRSKSCPSWTCRAG